ncbi:MAG: transcription factor S [Candidatus Bathyarchaeota archaeon]|nr:MAG: transcription factor S [Candidatus Bathyarchaeota archaeon]
MKFCAKCSTRLVLNSKTLTNNSTSLICPKCGYQKQEDLDHVVVPKSLVHSPLQDKIAVIGEVEENIRTMSTTKMECQKCGNKEAYWWMVQTRGSDESPTQFFRCTQCNHTWREMA